MGQTLSEPVVEKVRLSNAPPRPRTAHSDPAVCLGNGRRRECARAQDASL
jgi:hypothetical protein